MLSISSIVRKQTKSCASKNVCDISKKLTYLLGVDNEENYYAVYYQGSAEVYDGDEITVYAIPCETTSFSNVSGGSTNVVVMAACAIN